MFIDLANHLLIVIKEGIKDAREPRDWAGIENKGFF